MTKPEKPIQQYRFAVAAFFFISGICFASWASRIPTLKHQLQLSEAALGNVLLALPIGSMISLPLSGWLVAKLGSRKSLLIASLLYSFLLLCLAFINTTWQLAALLVVFGIAGNYFNISVNTQAVDVEKKMGKPIMSGFHGVWSLAGFAGGAIAFLFFRLQIPMLVHFSLITVFAWINIFFFYQNIDDKSYTNAGENSKPLLVKPDQQLLLLGIIAFCCMSYEGTMFDWSGVYFEKIVHTPPALIATGYVAFMGAMATGRFAGDTFTQRIGIQKMLFISGFTIAAGLTLAVVLPTLVFATIGFLLVGFGVSTVVPLVYSAAGHHPKMQAGVALAAVSSIGFLGFLLGPPLIGYVAQAMGLQTSFTIIALLGLGTSIMTYVNKKW